MNPVLLHELSDDEDDDFCASHKVKVSHVLGPRICFTGERGSDETENSNGSLDARNCEIIGAKSLPLFESFVTQSKAKNKSLDEEEDRKTLVFKKRKARTYVLEDSDEEEFRPARNKHEEMQRKFRNIPMLKQTVVIDIADEEESEVAQQKAVDVTGEFRNLQKKREGLTSEEFRNVMMKQDLVIDDSDDGEFGPEPVQMKLQETSGNFRNAIMKQNAVVHDGDREFGPELMKLKDTPGGFRNVKMKWNNVDNDEAIARMLQEEEDLTEFGSLLYTQDEETESQVDLIKNTLQKCDEIAASLRKELNVGGSITDSGGCNMDSYAEIDASIAKIVSQSDVCAACQIKENYLQLILKPYQLVGVNFLMLLYRKKVGGAILADEMGLGKTIQAISFLAVLNHLDRDPGPHLVICPASLLENWSRELKKWCSHFSVVSYHGSERSALFKELNRIAKAGKPAPFNVMLTCYSLFERQSAQQKDDRKLLRRFKWSCILMDEAHLLKDRDSRRRKHLWALAQKAKQRLLLTGTPLQNDLQELWSLLEFMLPEIFDSGDFDLKAIFGNRATSDNQMDNVDLITRIKAILGPFVLRRLKSDVMQQLVAKTQKIEIVEMPIDQAEAYKEALEGYRATARLAQSARASSKELTNAVDILPRRQVSNYFTQFRKIANHPLLLRRIYTDADVDSLAKALHPRGAFGFECTLERVREELMSYSDYALHKLSESYGGLGQRGVLSNSYALGSAKCQALSKLLPKLKKEAHRVLIFSQWTGMMDILEWALDVMGLEYTRLDGSTPVADRQNIIDDYNNDLDIFACLLSTRAGGQGLNLTGADTVIIHDMDFNPQMDRQAEDRCHRIGQTKPVTVYRLVTKGTVDEDIYSIAKRKLILDAAVLETGTEVNDNNNENEVLRMGAILSAILDAAPS